MPRTAPLSRRVHSDNRHTRLSARSLPHIAGSLALICAGTDGQSASASRQLCAPGRRAVRFTACSRESGLPALRGRLRRSPSACYRRDVLGQARPRVRAVRRSPRTVPVALPTAVPAAVPDASWIGMDQTVPVVLPRGGRRAGAATAPAPAGSYQHRVAVHTPSRRLDVPSRHRVGRTLRLAYERGRSGAGISSSASSPSCAASTLCMKVDRCVRAKDDSALSHKGARWPRGCSRHLGLC